MNHPSDPIQRVPSSGASQVSPQQSQPGQQQADSGQSAGSPDDFGHYVPTIDTPAIAEDIDLIEKEWVDKAKDIVERTKHDPRVQSKEINKLRADYLKKRYDRDIKLQQEE